MGERVGFATATALVCLLAAGPAHARTAEEIVADVRVATARYLDIARARDDGYVQTSAMEPRHGYHLTHLGLRSAIRSAPHSRARAGTGTRPPATTATTASWRRRVPGSVQRATRGAEPPS